VLIQWNPTRCFLGSLTDMGFESLSPHVGVPLFGITLGEKRCCAGQAVGITLGVEAMESLLYIHG
jgi:hypothetical protein